MYNENEWRRQELKLENEKQNEASTSVALIATFSVFTGSPLFYRIARDAFRRIVASLLIKNLGISKQTANNLAPSGDA